MQPILITQFGYHNILSLSRSFPRWSYDLAFVLSRENGLDFTRLVLSLLTTSIKLQMFFYRWPIWQGIGFFVYVRVFFNLSEWLCVFVYKLTMICIFVIWLILSLGSANSRPPSSAHWLHLHLLDYFELGFGRRGFIVAALLRILSFKDMDLVPFSWRC